MTKFRMGIELQHYDTAGRLIMEVLDRLIQIKEPSNAWKCHFNPKHENKSD